MTRVRRHALAVLVAASLVGSACGLDDGARVRNQDNVRDDDPPSETDTLPSYSASR